MTTIKVIEINPKIFIAKFKNNHELASTFLRFQEHYEHPEFRRKVFTLEEFKKWFIPKHGKFNYLDLYDGFNIPSTILTPFYKGKFNPLSKKEKQLLRLFSDKKHPFYIIGVRNRCKKSKLKHELAHALFYTDKEYKKQVLKILKRFDTKKIINELKKRENYADNVLLDEVHAWALCDSKLLETPIPAGLNKALNSIYNKYIIR